MWTVIALVICLTWAAILKAQGHPWSTVIMRPLIGLGALMLATVFHAIAFVAFGIAFVAFGIALLCALTRRAV